MAKTPQTDQTLPAEETRTVYGLREKASGRILRVEAQSEHEYTYGSDEPVASIRYTLTLDESHPVFNAGSRLALANVFAKARGDDADTPQVGRFTPSTVEPVVMTEIVRRSIEPAAVEFDVVVQLSLTNIFDVQGPIVDKIPELREVLDIAKEHAQELRDVVLSERDGNSWKAGPYRLVAMVVPDRPDVSVVPGARVNGDGAIGLQRRALAVIDLPEDFLELAARRRDPVPYHGAIVVALGDDRVLPESLREALVARFGDAPLPRP